MAQTTRLSRRLGPFRSSPPIPTPSIVQKHRYSLNRIKSISLNQKKTRKKIRKTYIWPKRRVSRRLGPFRSSLSHIPTIPPSSHSPAVVVGGGSGGSDCRRRPSSWCDESAWLGTTPNTPNLERGRRMYIVQ
jgi:hypothetical protein